MFPANGYVIRKASVDDQATLHRLAGLDGQRPISGDALIGEIEGVPAAAISLADGRVVADPFRPTARLTPLLRLRARSLRAYASRPSLRERLLAGLRPAAEAV